MNLIKVAVCVVLATSLGAPLSVIAASDGQHTMGRAPGTYTGVSDTTRANCLTALRAKEAAKIKQIQANTPVPAGDFFRQSSCIDSILNTRINIFTMGSLDGLLGKIIQMGINQACGAAMGEWNRALGQVNQTVGVNTRIPGFGGGGGVRVGQGNRNSGPVTVNNQPIGNSSLKNVYR